VANFISGGQTRELRKSGRRPPWAGGEVNTGGKRGKEKTTKVSQEGWRQACEAGRGPREKKRYLIPKKKVEIKPWKGEKQTKRIQKVKQSG